MIRYCIPFLLFAVYLPVTAYGLEIRFKESAEIKGKTFTLGEIASIFPGSAEAEAMAATNLFQAPEPGKTISLETSKVKEYLIHSDKALINAHWDGPKNIRIKRASIVIGPDRITKILTDYLDRHKDFLPNAEIRFKELGLPRPFELPSGKIDIEVIPSHPSILASHRFTLIFRVDGNVEKNLAVRGLLEAIAPVVVATGNLRRGTLIHSQDVTLAMLDLNGLQNPCFDPQELIDKKLKRSVRQGHPLDCRNVEFPPMIRRGDFVTITARKGALTVSAKGIAEHDAKQGETIKVVNSSSRREIICKVSAPGLVTVEI